MPMVDYVCSDEECGYEFEQFFHDPPATLPCCRMYPTGISCSGTAQRVFLYPGSRNRFNAQRFEPIVIHQSVSDPNSFSFPGASSDRCPAGYRPIHITNMREAERWTKRINNLETSKATELRDMNREYFEEKTIIRRQEIDSRMRANGMDGSGRARFLRDMARRLADRRHAKNFGPRAMNANFHIQALEFDSSNRNPHSGPETDWKQRRR